MSISGQITRLQAVRNHIRSTLLSWGVIKNPSADLEECKTALSSIQNHGSVNGTISSRNDEYTVQSGYHDGKGKVSVSASEQEKLVRENIKKGVTLLGVEGSYLCESADLRGNGIVLFDYDKNVVKSYTVSEFAEITELPDPPEHEGLIFRGWNWSLEDIKALGHPVDVGALYVTESGRSEFDITLTAVTGTDVTIRIYNVTAGDIISVDWGDGTQSDATSTTVGAKTLSHTYAAPGDYTPSVDSTGEYRLYGTSSAPYNMFNVSPSYICTAARLGERCTGIAAHAFHNCYSVSSITVSDRVTLIDSYSFQYCYGLESITIPDGILTLSSYAFQNCYSLTHLSAPNTIESVGAYAFQYCYALTSEIVIPEGVSSINNNAFSYCYSIKKYIMLPEVPPTLQNINVFTGINNICIIEVPKGSLSAYQTATNWATYAGYMKEAEL